MSILIKGMEMPKDCNTCCFHGFGDRDCKLIVCSLTGNSTPLSHIADCPLIEVPPHGRLIDGIDLLKAITENAYIIHHGHNEVEYGMSCFGIMQAISEAPTIIEAEEGEAHECINQRHGNAEGVYGLSLL